MVLWQGSMWCMTSAQAAPVASPSFTLRDSRIPKRQWSEPMAWSWMVGASEWIIPLPNVPTPPHQESTWDDQLTMEVGAAAVVAAGGVETHTMTVVAMTATTDTTSTTTGIVAGALHHPTTVDTGLAHGLAPTAHGDTKLLLPAFSFPSNK